MNIKEAVRGYGAAAKALHWLTAVLVVLQVTLALRAWKLPPGSVKNALLGQHMSVGLCVLLLTIVRLGWRRQHGAPALPESISPRLQVGGAGQSWAAVRAVVAAAAVRLDDGECGRHRPVAVRHRAAAGAARGQHRRPTRS